MGDALVSPDGLCDADGFSLADACRLSNVSHETFERLAAYADILDQWRPRLNLIGPDERTRLWRRHVYDSLRLLPHIHLEQKARLVDLGSGAGFPGLILACAFAESAPIIVTLIETHTRRAAFLRAAAIACGLNIHVINTRIEPGKADQKIDDPFDYVTARALAPLPRLLALSMQYMSKDGWALFLKGRNAPQEIERASDSWSFNLNTIKHSDGGVILNLTHIMPRTHTIAHPKERSQ